jgi:hypothetical protein
MKRPILILSLLLLPLVSVAQAAKVTMPSFEGLAEKAKETVNITLDRDMLQMASGFLGGKSGDAARDAEVADIVKGLDGIYVRVFSFDKAGQYSQRDIESVLQQTKAPGWKSLMQVRDGEERVEMWMHERASGGGFLLVVTEPMELVIVNIAGDVDLRKLAKLQGRMGIPGIPGIGGAAPVAPVAPAAPAPPAAPGPGASSAPPAVGSTDL